MHGGGFDHFLFVSHLLCDLPCWHAKGAWSCPHQICGSSLVSPLLPHSPCFPFNTGHCDCSDGDSYCAARHQAELGKTQTHRQMDLALLDVCVRDRSGDLFVVVSDFSASAGVRFFEPTSPQSRIHRSGALTIRW